MKLNRLLLVIATVVVCLLPMTVGVQPHRDQAVVWLALQDARADEWGNPDYNGWTTDPFPTLRRILDVLCHFLDADGVC